MQLLIWVSKSITLIYRRIAGTLMALPIVRQNFMSIIAPLTVGLIVTDE
ncbi:hypothetical protein DOY81_011264, partial [Sarcophaga bullata]